MEDATRIVGTVRRRLMRIRLVEQFQAAAVFTLTAALLVGVIGHLFGFRLSPLTALCTGVILALVISLVRTWSRPLSRAHAASEADRILGTRERLSTALALSEGRAVDPLGLAPALTAGAADALRHAPVQQIARTLRPRFRRSFVLAALSGAALFLLPLLPLRAIAAPDGPPPSPSELRQVAEELRVLEKKLKKKEDELSRAGRKMAREQLKRLRLEVAKLRGEAPRRSHAADRLKKLERQAKDLIRRAAGMKSITKKDTELAENETLNELSEALKAMEEADLNGTRARMSALWDKLRENKSMAGLSPAELASMERSVRELNDAMRSLSAKLGEQGEMAKYLKGLAESEALKQLARALSEMRQLMEERGLMPEDMDALAQAMRNYRNLQLSEADIQEMLKALEELKKLLESGADISMCRGAMSGLLLPGFGMGIFPGGGGLGRSALGRSALGRRAGQGIGDGTGGAGSGRGGNPGTNPDDQTTSPDLIPGTPGLDGRVTLIRTIRSLPSPDDDPEEYQRLMREASLEAEEALRQGEIPRAYRGYVRRFFSGPEDE